MELRALDRAWTLALSFAACCGTAYLAFRLFSVSALPLTLDMLFNVFLAEYNTFANRKRRRAAAAAESGTSSPSSIDKGVTRSSDTLAAIVGYREDPTLFSKALQSYVVAERCKFVLVCVDGNDAEDQEMTRIFQRTYPTGASCIQLRQTMGQTMLKALAREDDCAEEAAMQHCRQVVRDCLKENNIHLFGPQAITRLCLNQPHMNKREAMFTSFLFAGVISEALGVEFLWTSDSDSWLSRPDTISQVITAVVTEPSVGGASATLTIHNRDDSVVSSISDAFHRSEMHVTKSYAGALGASDCQSGPSALFRIEALAPVIFSWYRQSFFGHKMITNEDRHLTTRLLSHGWKIAYISDAYVETESPTTMRKLVLQQADVEEVRWARAVFIETVGDPKIYLVQSPVLFSLALRRVPASTVAPLAGLFFLFWGQASWLSQKVSPLDLALRFSIRFIYVLAKHPELTTWRTALWSLPGQIFYSLTMPMFALWGTITCCSDAWEAPRATVEKRSVAQLSKEFIDTGFFVVWGAVLMGGWAHSLAVQNALGPALSSLIAEGGFVAGLVLLAVALYWSVLVEWMGRAKR